MFRKGGWLIVIALLSALFQSWVWMALSLASALVYVCVIPVPPYQDQGDFFPVTTVKLYFEGPGCIPDGSYLGQFNKDYRNPEVLSLFTPDKVFALMVAYFVANFAYCILTIKCWLNRRVKSAEVVPWQRDLFRSWSGMTLIICALDVFFVVKLVDDIIKLNEYMGDKEGQSEVIVSSAIRNNAEIPYIPLLLALISSRIIGLWIWNFIIGLLFFFNSLYCRSFAKGPPKTDKEQEEEYLHEDAQPSLREHSAPKNSPSRNYISAYDICGSEKSSEAVTRFSSSAPKTVYPKEKWSYSAGEGCWESSKGKDSWGMSNEGYVSDEQTEGEKSPDFDHDLKNFEQGQRKIKFVKPPKGKPVSIPVPPPLPTSGSCRGEERVTWQKKHSQRESRCFQEILKR